jgi:hypothetical protein
MIDRCLVIRVDASVHKYPPTKRASSLRIACGLTDEFDRLVILFDRQQVIQSMQSGSKMAEFCSKKEVVGSLFAYANRLYDLEITIEGSMVAFTLWRRG